MVRIELVYEGELHTQCSHGPSTAQLTTDAPVDNHGRGESFSPTDLLASALGSCMLTVMGIRARSEGWELEGTRASVEKHMTTKPVRRVSRLAVQILLPTSVARLGAADRALLEHTARSCPVAQSIHPDVALDLDMRWPG